MKILFFTPVVLASAIGRVSNLIVIELIQQEHDVVVVRTEDPILFENPAHPFLCRVVAWNNTKLINQLASESDLIVYQIGNHYPYHRGCLEWLPTVQGLVSLHDVFLGHLFWSWSEKVGRPKALELLKNFYGADIAGKFFNHTDSTSFITYTSEVAPMTEWIASMASAVIVHSSWTINRIALTCSGPVEVAPLPYDAPFLEVDNLKIKTTTKKQVVALTIGNVNHNKRYASIIKAIAASPQLLERMTFRIVGSIEPTMEHELITLAKNLGVKIVITGAVDDQGLANEIHGADIMCCLRWPALEAASASTIEAMLYGKAIVVTNTGFYRDLPYNCVLKISPETELTDLRLALEKLLSSSKERKALGKLAQDYAIKTFRADNYAERIINMNKRINRSNIVSTTAIKFATTLKQWGANGDQAIMKSIASPLDLFS